MTGAKEIGIPFELTKASDVHRTPFTNAHYLATVRDVLLRKFVSTGTLLSCHSTHEHPTPASTFSPKRAIKTVTKGPSYRVEKNLFSENQKSKLGFDWSECQHATHGDFDISEILFSAKKSWGTFS